MRIALSLTVSLLCLGVAGCGQKGPLFLPTEPPAPSAPATAPSTQSPQSAQPAQSTQLK